jgi:hypothetical protein
MRIQYFIILLLCVIQCNSKNTQIKGACNIHFIDSSCLGVLNIEYSTNKVEICGTSYKVWTPPFLKELESHTDQTKSIHRISFFGNYVKIDEKVYILDSFNISVEPITNIKYEKFANDFLCFPNFPFFEIIEIGDPTGDLITQKYYFNSATLKLDSFSYIFYRDNKE